MSKEIKFFDTGKFAEHKPWMDQIEVKTPGETHTVSNEMAEIVVDAGKAEYVAAAEPKKLTDAEALELARGMSGKGKGKNKNRK